MHFAEHQLEALALSARAGDRAAAADFRRQVGPQIGHMVRRVLRTGTATSPLDKRILAEMAQVLPPDRRLAREDLAPVIAHIARRLCDAVLEAAPDRPRHPLGDTVLCG